MITQFRVCIHGYNFPDTSQLTLILAASLPMHTKHTHMQK